MSLDVDWWGKPLGLRRIGSSCDVWLPQPQVYLCCGQVVQDKPLPKPPPSWRRDASAPHEKADLSAPIVGRCILAMGACYPSRRKGAYREKGAILYLPPL